MALEIYSNCNKITLLSNSDIIITFNGNKYVFHIPTLGELYTAEYDPGFFIGFMTMDYEDFAEKMETFETSRVRYIRFIKSQEKPELYDASLLYFLQICCKGSFTIVDDWLVVNHKIIIDEVLDAFIECFKVGMGMKTLKEFQDSFQSLTVKKTAEEEEWDRQAKKAQERINKAKAKNDKHYDLEQILSAISYEFKISFEDLIHKNFYTIYSLYNSSIAIDAHKVSNIAMGNGLTKAKYKHWIEK